MSSIFTLICLVAMVIPPSLGNIICYPFFPKLSLKISNYISKRLAPWVFAVLDAYLGFKFWAYKEHVDELPDQYIVITNHQSLLDIPVVMNFMRNVSLRFVAKDILGRHIPLISEMLRIEKHCLIPRKAKPMDAMNYIGKFGEQVVRENQVPVLFPEGSRTKDGKVGKFYSAGFRKLTESSNLPVVVCALDGGYQIRDLFKIFTNLKRGCYRIKIVKIYEPPKSKEEANEILEESKALIQNQVEEWRKLPSLKKY
ncbi:MAG: 1-acyl-sn-glycerol-3-phosphate acyltransferase [Treponema bryantii]|nr:1-acyl-sn-glycerol-3-phosphate acyltransferase [Treponema bryantii]